MSEEKIREDIGKLTGLTRPPLWGDANELLRAKARITLADKNSLQKEALQYIEDALKNVFEKHLIFETERHGRVRSLFRKWERSEIDIDEFWVSLREIVDGPRDSWDDYS